MTLSQSSFLPPPPVLSFNLYHDESGNYVGDGGDRWLLHGVLFVPEHRQGELLQALQAAREETKYHHELHFTKLRGKTGPRANCIHRWLKIYLGFSDYCYYHCLAVDTRSTSFQHDRFSDAYHVYNYFARTAMVGGIAWSMKGQSKIKLSFYSDAKRRPQRDNFAEYIPGAVQTAIHQKRQTKPGNYPEIDLTHRHVILVDSNPQSVTAELQSASEFIQLTDLLTASVAQAIIASSGIQAKVNMGQMLASWIEDTRKPPWLQTNELHRRFSLSCFPNDKGEFYNPVLAVSQRDQLQLPLF